uniref:putative quinol monooxygenase n=1 Tax=Aliarcobacter sp. TaxID=2321116 RepID=UPI004048C228
MAITRQIIFLAKRDCIEELKELLKSTIEETKKEEGCLMYEVFQTKSNLVEFIVIDSWESEEALNKHYETAHYSNFINNFKQYNAHIEPFELEHL